MTETRPRVGFFCWLMAPSDVPSPKRGQGLTESLSRKFYLSLIRSQL